MPLPCHIYHRRLQLHPHLLQDPLFGCTQYISRRSPAKTLSILSLNGKNASDQSLHQSAQIQPLTFCLSCKYALPASPVKFSPMRRRQASIFLANINVNGIISLCTAIPLFKQSSKTWGSDGEPVIRPSVLPVWVQCTRDTVLLPTPIACPSSTKHASWTECISEWSKIFRSYVCLFAEFFIFCDNIGD